MNNGQSTRCCNDVACVFRIHNIGNSISKNALVYRSITRKSKGLIRVMEQNDQHRQIGEK